ncbi:MAG TPA: LamG domain-containing protein, partial [Planctomycetota bacterium]|nr:LamG domain-containing protein [Planctomycetota bacterium]
ELPLREAFSWTAGRSGSAVRLDGSGAHVELPNTPELDRLQGGSYTISIWFKPDTLPQDPNEKSWGGAAALVMKGPFREGLVYIAGGHFLLIHWLAGGKWTAAGSWAETSGPGTWYHVVGVVDRGAGQDRIFVDGLLKASESWAKETPAQEFGPDRWTLGKVKYGGENDYPVRGALCDLRFYDRALEAQEVAALHASGPGSGK